MKQDYTVSQRLLDLDGTSNTDNFLDHLVHHLLSIYSLGANAQQIQAAYDLNKNYQRSTGVQFQTTGHKLLDAETFKMHLGDSKYYQNYLEFFQNEIALNGVEKVLNEYLFKGDDKADDLLIRMYSGVFFFPASFTDNYDVTFSESSG